MFGFVYVQQSFEIWCWRRMEIIWADHVKNEVLHKVNKERNILRTIKEEILTELVTSFLGTASETLYSGKDRIKDRR
jgi:hypothetical protein